MRTRSRMTSPVAMAIATGRLRKGTRHALTDGGRPAATRSAERVRRSSGGLVLTLGPAGGSRSTRTRQAQSGTSGAIGGGADPARRRQEHTSRPSGAGGVGGAWSANFHHSSGLLTCRRRSTPTCSIRSSNGRTPPEQPAGERRAVGAPSLSDPQQTMRHDHHNRSRTASNGWTALR